MTSQSKIEKKRQILNSALELFVQNDIDKTSTISIAKHAKVSNGTLFHYFSTKNELIIDLFIILKTEMFNHIYSNNLNKIKSIKKMIESGCLNAIHWITKNKKKYAYIHKVYKSNYKQLLKDDELPENYLHYLSIIKTGIEKKELKNIPAELMVNIINNQVYSLAEYYSESNTEPNEKFNKKIFEMIWHCIKY